MQSSLAYRQSRRARPRLLEAISIGPARAALAALQLGGCAAGPEFQSPPPPSISRLTPGGIEETPSLALARRAYVRDLDIPARWWELFHCRPLETLIRRAVEDNSDIAAARAAVRIAEANTEAARGGFFPQVGASANASSQKPDPAAAGAASGSHSPYSAASGQVRVAFVPDVFGLNRRKVESLAAEAEAQQLELEAALVTLAARLALAAVEEASLRAQIRAAEESLRTGREVLALLAKRASVKDASVVDLAAQKVALTELEQRLQDLRKRLALGRNAMIAMTGHLAGEGLPERFELACLKMPARVPLSLPSEIVRQRPDVRAAEARMHAATADVGVAIASRLPQLTLTADASALVKVATLSSPLMLWSIAGSLAQTLFDGLSGEQRQRAAEAGLDRAAALYRSAVIGGFQNIADVLHAIDSDRRSAAIARRRVEAAETGLAAMRELLMEGQADGWQVLQAQQAHAQALAARAEAEAARRADVILLMQALGGGWWNRGGGDGAQAYEQAAAAADSAMGAGAGRAK